MNTDIQTKPAADHLAHDIRLIDQVQVLGKWVELGTGAYRFCIDCDSRVA